MQRKNILSGLLTAVAFAPLTVTASTIVLSESSVERNVTQIAQIDDQNRLRKLLERGRELVDTKNYQAATQVYEQAAQLDSDNPKIFSGIGYLEANQGNYQEAASAYQRAVNLAPDNAEFYYALGHSLAKIEDYAGATTAFYRATELAPQKVDAYLGLATVLLRQSDRAGALSIYQKLLKFKPNHREANAMVGSLLLQLENYSGAIAHLKKLTQMPSPPTSAWFDLAKAYQKTDQYSFALKTMETFLQDHPNHARGYYQKGKLLEQQGKLEAAKSAYQEAVSLGSTPVEALAALGAIQLKEEQYLDAIVTYRRLTDLVPDNPGIQYNLGLALKGRDRVSEARVAFQKAYRLFVKVGNQEGKDRSQMQLRKL